MSSQNDQQASELAKEFLMMAEAVSDFKLSHWDNLTDGERKNLDQQHADLLRSAQMLFTQSANSVLNEVTGSISTIRNASSQIHVFLAKVADTQKGIKLIAGVVAVATSLMAGKPMEIAKSIDGVLDQLKMDAG
jgi:hypothetical protein